jgi:hypothetical protein
MYPLYKANANNMDSNPMSGILEDGRIGTGCQKRRGYILRERKEVFWNFLVTEWEGRLEARNGGDGNLAILVKTLVAIVWATYHDR